MLTTKNIILSIVALFAFAASSVFAGSYGEAKKTSAEAGQDIVAIASENGSFSTLVAALVAGDLVETLQGEGPFTVFAPSDEAFAKLPEGTVEELLKPENKDQLVSILTYHVVPGEVYAKDVINLEGATTVQGSDIAITTEGDTVKINDATVISADIKASNGVIHVIDTVIMPDA